jgi:hypothetical protein
MVGLTVAGGLAYAATTAAKPAATDQDGLAAASALTKVTGVAISPLLGVGCVGAYDWWKADTAAEKAALPWYAQVHFWLPALLLVGVVALKDVAGAALPPGWKKPLDVAETVESKVSGLVAVGAFVPFVAAIFGKSLQTTGGEPEIMAAGMLGVNFTWLLNLLTVPLAITAFVLVWLVGHVFNVLILISPWGGFDAVLKAMRTTALGALTAIHLMDPRVAALISLLIVIFAYFVAGWSFRMMVYGSVFTWDFFSLRHRRFKPAPNANWMFTARKIEMTPVRSYGKLVKQDDGQLTFEYRPWLVLPKQSVTLPEGPLAVGRGLFYPDILLVNGKKTKSLLTLPPRYRKHEDELGQIYGIADVRDTGMLKGIKAVWRWFTRNLFGADSKEATAAAATA